jgi:hypothetical protein
MNHVAQTFEADNDVYRFLDTVSKTTAIPIPESLRKYMNPILPEGSPDWLRNIVVGNIPSRRRGRPRGARNKYPVELRLENSDAYVPINGIGATLMAWLVATEFKEQGEMVVHEKCTELGIAYGTVRKQIGNVKLDRPHDHRPEKADAH